MSQGERVLVLGATRGTGLLIARRLLREGYRVRALSRDATRVRAVFGSEVESAVGDVTRPETLAPALAGVDHVVVTVGVTKRPAGERLVRATEFDGTLNVLAAAVAAGLRGRFMYMSALGTTRWSLLGFLLDLIKGNTLRWRRRAEERIRARGLAYTIVHAGILSNAPAGWRPVVLGQRDLPLAPWYRVARADVAEVFVEALRRPEARNATFDAVWGRGRGPTDWAHAFAGLAPDGSPERARRR
jgi:uncharacterized protein YbjT (DUF2867 family)